MFSKSYHFDVKPFSAVRLVSKTALALVLLSGLSYPVLGMDDPTDREMKRALPVSEDDQGFPNKRPRTMNQEDDGADELMIDQNPTLPWSAAFMTNKHPIQFPFFSPFVNIDLMLTPRAYDFLKDLRKRLQLHNEKYKHLEAPIGEQFLEWENLKKLFIEHKKWIFVSLHDRSAAERFARTFKEGGATYKLVCDTPIPWLVLTCSPKEIFGDAQKNLSAIRNSWMADPGTDYVKAVRYKEMTTKLFDQYNAYIAPGLTEQIEGGEDASGSSLKYVVLLRRFENASNGSDREAKKLSKLKTISTALDSFTPDSILNYLQKEYRHWRTFLHDNVENSQRQNTKNTFIYILDELIKGRFLVNPTHKKLASNLKAAFEGNEETAQQFVGPDLLETISVDCLRQILTWISRDPLVQSIVSLQRTNKYFSKTIADIRQLPQDLHPYVIDLKGGSNEQYSVYMAKRRDSSIETPDAHYLSTFRLVFPQQNKFSLKIKNEDGSDSDDVGYIKRLFGLVRDWTRLTSLTLVRADGLSGIGSYLTNLSELSLSYERRLDLPKYQKNTKLNSLTLSCPPEEHFCGLLEDAGADNETGMIYLDQDLKKLPSVCPNLTFINLAYPRVRNVNSFASFTNLKALTTLHLNIMHRRVVISGTVVDGNLILLPKPQFASVPHSMTSTKFTTLVDVLKNVKLQRLELGGYLSGIADQDDITPDHPDLYQLYLRGVEVVWDSEDAYSPKNAPVKKDSSERDVPIKCNEGWETRKAQWKNAFGNAKQ